MSEPTVRERSILFAIPNKPRTAEELEAEFQAVEQAAFEMAAKVCDRWAADNIATFREQGLAAESCARRIRELAKKRASK